MIGFKDLETTFKTLYETEASSPCNAAAARRTGYLSKLFLLSYHHRDHDCGFGTSKACFKMINRSRQYRNESICRSSARRLPHRTVRAKPFVSRFFVKPILDLTFGLRKKKLECTESLVNEIRRKEIAEERIS